MAFTHSMTKYATFADALAGIKNTMVTAGWTASTDFATIAAGLSNVANNTAYVLGDMKLPVVAGYANVILVCTQSGTTHASTAITPSSTFTGEITSGTAKFKTIWKAAWIMSCTPSYTSPTGYMYIGGAAINTPTSFTTFTFGGYLPSNSSALIFHCPVYDTASVVALTLYNSSYYTDVWADSTSVYISSQENTGSGYRYFAGFPATDAINDITTVTAPATAGSSVSVSVANATKFQPNKSYRWYAADGSWREKVTISAITNSTTIVISTLRTNIPNGAYFGSLPNLFMGTLTRASYYYYHLFDNAQVTDVNSAGAVLTNVSGYGIVLPTPGFTGVGYCNNKYSLSSFFCGLDNSVYGAFPSWFAYNGTGSLGDIFGVGENYRGSASAGGNTTMTDGGATWTTNQWAGKRLCLTSGTGAGQTRSIASNTGTEITINNAWATNPGSGTTYTICDSSWRHTTFLSATNISALKIKEGN